MAQVAGCYSNQRLKTKTQARHRISQATTLNKQPRGEFQHAPAAPSPSHRPFGALQNQCRGAQAHPRPVPMALLEITTVLGLRTAFPAQSWLFQPLWCAGEGAAPGLGVLGPAGVPVAKQRAVAPAASTKDGTRPASARARPRPTAGKRSGQATPSADMALGWLQEAGDRSQLETGRGAGARGDWLAARIQTGARGGWGCARGWGRSRGPGE